MAINPTRNPDPLLGNKDAAEYIGDNPRTLANRRCRGEGPDYVKIGHHVKYPKSALDRYIRSRTVRLNDEKVA